MQPVTRPVTLYPRVPCGVLLHPKAISVYTMLKLMAHNSGEACVRLETIAEYLGQKTGGRVTAYITELCNAGLIEVLPGRRVLHYKLKA